MPIRCLKTRMSKTMNQNKPVFFVNHYLRFFWTVLESWTSQWASWLWLPWFLQSKRDVEVGESEREGRSNVIEANPWKRQRKKEHTLERQPSPNADEGAATSMTCEVHHTGWRPVQICFLVLLLTPWPKTLWKERDLCYLTLYSP